MPWLGVLAFFIAALWRLPGAYSFVSLLDFVPLAVMHLPFARAQIALTGERGVATRLHWIEWIVVVLGCGMWVLVLIGAALPDEQGVHEAGLPVAVAAFAVSAVALVIIGRVSRRATVEGIALHAATVDTSPVTG